MMNISTIKRLLLCMFALSMYLLVTFPAHHIELQEDDAAEVDFGNKDKIYCYAVSGAFEVLQRLTFERMNPVLCQCIH
jgi:hypothetical protein